MKTQSAEAWNTKSAPISNGAGFWSAASCRGALLSSKDDSHKIALRRKAVHFNKISSFLDTNKMTVHKI